MEVINVSIKGCAEDDEHDLPWYKVKCVKISDDIEEYEFTDNNAVLMYRERYPRAGFEEFYDFSSRDLCNVLALQ
jgi:hypothetical protein